MSEFHVRVFRISRVGKHPNADTLSLTQGPSGYPVCFKTGDFAPGDLAVHIPVDAVVDTAREEFSWLAPKATVTADGRALFRVKATKLRGVPSYGFLVPCPEAGVNFSRPPEGADVRLLLGVEKYEPGPCFQQDGIVQGNMSSLPQDAMVPLYDIEGMRRYSHCIDHGDLVSVTEKIHGSNGRWGHIAGVFLSGSRTKFRTASVWNRMAERYDLERILGAAENRGLVLYGEVYGKGIQDLTYGTDEPHVAFFDLYSTITGLWFTPDKFKEFCYKHSLPVVPELYRGPYDAVKVSALAEGNSTLPGAHDQVREGVVVKPLVERWDQEIGRVFLKQPGEGYLLRKGPSAEHEADIRARASFVVPAPTEAPNVAVQASDQPEPEALTWWQKVCRAVGL